MNTLKLFLQPIKFAFTISLVSLGFALVQKQSAKSVIVASHPTSIKDLPNHLSISQLNTPLIFNAPTPPDDIGSPVGRPSGGRRNPCQVDEKPLKALVPVYEIRESELVLGFTNAEYPTLWFYVPYVECPLEFVLKDEDDNDIYQTILTEADALTGVISIRVPSSVTPLKIGKRYHWYLSVLNPKKSEEVVDSVDGWVQRESLNPNIQSQLETATLSQRVTLYAANGMWHDALTTAAELRRIDGNSHEWTVLLQAVDLEDIASEPILECCQPER